MATSRKQQSSNRPKSTLEALELEAAVEPFVYVTLSGEEIVFPNPADMDVEQAEDLIWMFKDFQENPQKSRVIFEAWIGEENTNKIFADRPTYQQVLKITQMILNHYEGAMASLGESIA